MDAGIHADGIARTSLDAEAAEDAAQLVDHETLGEALVATLGVTFGILAGFDVDALRRARGRTAQTSHAARRAVVAMGQAVQPAKARRIGPALLGITQRVDAV